MKHAAKFLISASILLWLCVSATSATPRCTDNCRRGSRGTGRNRNPWRMSAGDRQKYLEGRLAGYRSEFYGGGGQETIDKLTDKLRGYRDFWVKWRSKYQDLPAGSKERDTIVDKLRWVRDVLRGGRDLKNEFETSLAGNSGDSGGPDGGSGGNGGDASAPGGAATTSTPGADTTTPTPSGGSKGQDGPGAAGMASDPVNWILLTIADQEQDPQLRANIDTIAAEAVTRAVNEAEGHNASEERIAAVIKILKNAMERRRQRGSGGSSK